MIAKVETSSEDTVCIFQKIGFNQFMDGGDLGNSSSSSSNNSNGTETERLLFNVDEKLHVNAGGPSELLAEELFQTLDKTQVQKLYELYRMDFLAFGYSPEKFLDLARSSLDN